MGTNDFPGFALAAVAIFYVPVTSAGVRRLHDVGESGALMLAPLVPAASVWLLLTVVWWGAKVTGVGLLVFLAAFLVPEILMFAWVAIVIGTSVATLVSFSDTASKLMLPSEPGANRYGLAP